VSPSNVLISYEGEVKLCDFGIAHANDQLKTQEDEALKGKAGYHQLLYENNTGMPFEVAAASWQHYLGCPKWNQNVIDAIRAYREQYVDKGPEFIP